MSNPFYNGAPAQNNPMQAFVSFMRSMQGKDPRAMLNDLVASGKINQNQINIAQQRAKEMSGAFNSFRSMFGF